MVNERRRRQLEFTLVAEEGEAAVLDVRDENGRQISASSLSDLFGVAGVGEVSSVAGRAGDVVLTKTDVGLANLDNTSDANKPVSTAQQTALDLKANVLSAVSAKTAAYTLTASDDVVTADSTGGAFSLTLRTAVGIAGKVFTLKRINSGANDVTVATTSAQTIDGASTSVLTAQWQSVRVMSNGTNWLVV